MARTGRPHVPPEDRHSERIDLRLTPRDKRLLEEAAGSEKVASWARNQLLRAASRELRRRTTP